MGIVEVLLRLYHLYAKSPKKSRELADNRGGPQGRLVASGGGEHVSKI